MTPSALLLTAALLISAAPPSLPVPPAPPSSAQILGAHLAAGLLADSGVLPAPAAYEVRVSGTDRLELVALMADTLEAALRRGGVDASRVAERGTHRVDVALVVSRADVTATARLVRLPASVWEALRDPLGSVLATAVAGVGQDLDLRALSGQARVGVRVDRLRAVSVAEKGTPQLRSGAALDALVVDLDNDRRPEVVWLQADRLVVTRWAGGGFKAVGSADLTEIGAARSRARDPLGRLVAVSRADGSVVLVAATTDRRAASVWRLAAGGLVRVDVGEGSERWPLYATGIDRWAARGWPLGTDVLDDPLVEEIGLDGAAPQPLVSWPEPAHAVRTFGLRTRATPSWNPHFAVSDPGQGVRVWSAREPGVVHSFPRAGTVVAVADLNTDGRAEALLTSGSLTGRDKLALRELSAGRKRHKARWTHDLSAAVTAAAAGDVDADGYDEFVVATWNGSEADVWVVAPKVRR